MYTSNTFSAAPTQAPNREIKATSAPAAGLVWEEATRFNWGTVAIGTTSQFTFYVINNGSVQATGLTLTGMSGNIYQQVGGTCNTVLNPGVQCSYNFAF